MSDKAAAKADAKPAAPAHGGHGHGHSAQKFTGMSRWFNTYTYRGKTTVE